MFVIITTQGNARKNYEYIKYKMVIWQCGYFNVFIFFIILFK